MKLSHSYADCLVCCVMVSLLMPCMWAQEEAAPKRTGIPQDWSQRHIVFSRDALALHPDVIYRESRVLHQEMQRWQAPNSGVFHSAGLRPSSANSSSDHRDWSVSLGKGRLNANTFPAKFSFDPGAPPSCTSDYVVFGLDTAGVTSGQANLVAFNNLYSGSGGLCGAAPTVMFAYNTTTVAGGKIVTSPILSEDGTKIAFVESVVGAPGSAIFHVLTWTSGQGTISGAAAPASMTSLTYSTSAYNSASSPWIDYGSDTVYVGADNGVVYQITGVFKGTPTLSGAPWPVTVSSKYHLTPPVLDSTLGFLMVGSANGNLYQINTSTGALAALAVGKKGATGSAIVAAPIVDVTNGTTFVVTANDGVSAALVQVKTATMIPHSTAEIGQGSTGGTSLTLYEPAFSNNYFTDPSTGFVTLCGTGPFDTTPYQYAFGFTAGQMNETPLIAQPLSASITDRCTGWTEFFNPNINSGVDFFFFGLTQDCTLLGSSGSTTGCVVALSSDPTIPTASALVTGGPSGIVVDNYSTAAQASSIYFTAAHINTAYKLTQDGLQ